MRIVAALGGNALLRRDEPAEADVQQRNITRAAASLALGALEDAARIVTGRSGTQVSTTGA